MKRTEGKGRGGRDISSHGGRTWKERKAKEGSRKWKEQKAKEEYGRQINLIEGEARENTNGNRR